MFYSITGTLVTTEPAAAVIDVNGVAFYCNISAKISPFPFCPSLKLHYLSDSLFKELRFS